MASVTPVGDETIVVLSRKEALHLSALLRSFGGQSKTRRALTEGIDCLAHQLVNAGYFASMRESDGKTGVGFYPPDDARVCIKQATTFDYDQPEEDYLD